MNGVKYLLENNFKKHLNFRYVSLIGFAVFIPLFTILLLANNSIDTAMVFLTLSLIGSTLSELLGRYLFYVSVVPLGLAGNFFAGNQRGRDYKKDSHV